ncbi:uncharacterized protein LOC142220382 [Haematobia irritans]|uniref:uncharacterized protein LOC142220382 n=1 Tax=Haematobia irritans TaxID=7368 RepID=UPI003F502AC7
MPGMCRLCASLKPSVTKITDKSNPIAQKILHCCRIKIMESQNSLPKTVCQDCVDNLDVTYKFLKKVEESQKNLRAFFGSEGQAYDDSQNDEVDSMEIVDEIPFHETGSKRKSETNRWTKTTMENNIGSKHCKCNDLLSKIEDMKAQINTLIDGSKEQRTMLRKHLKYEPIELRSEFPIHTEEMLLVLNESINASNNVDYVNTIHSILHPAGVGKNLKFILGINLIMEYNIDGVHGKKSLKRLENFYKVLLAAIPNPPNNNAPAEDQLRKAIQLVKKRTFRSKCVSKKNESMNGSTNESTNETMNESISDNIYDSITETINAYTNETNDFTSHPIEQVMVPSLGQ